MFREEFPNNIFINFIKNINKKAGLIPAFLAKIFFTDFTYDMKILPITGLYSQIYTPKKTKLNQTAVLQTANRHNFYGYIPFTGYYGDNQPVKKLYWITSRQNIPKHDNWTDNHIYEYGHKKWINAYPNEILKRSPQDTINSIMTITGKKRIPDYIPSPDIGGDTWGRYANYIEINPRLIAKYDNGKISDGLLNTMKLMTMIPPSSDNIANCIILSQLYPSFYGDGTTHDETLYHVNLHDGISKNLTARGLDYRMGDDEQVKAFNDLAHLLGFKTGIRMPISSGQLRVKGEDFFWQKHEKAYIDACVWAIELGFDAIYFDSAKHIIDMNGYCGIGDVPNKKQMAYILYKIREQTGRTNLAFIGEKCSDNPVYQGMGFTAGTHWGDSINIEHVKHESRKQAGRHNYAAGPEVSNDNDYGEKNFEERLVRLNSCLFGYDNPKDKLPSFMQINDILPLSPYINTHQVMEHTIQMKGSDAWTECERHLDGVFRLDNDARNYTQKIYQIFSNAMYKN